VHLVFENEHLLKRDQADFINLFEDCGFADKVEYHVGIDFAPGEHEIIIIDEADCFIFESPA
jgi:hypothetical protein